MGYVGLAITRSDLDSRIIVVEWSRVDRNVGLEGRLPSLKRATSNPLGRNWKMRFDMGVAKMEMVCVTFKITFK